MPEGDTIFRTARSLGRALAGKPVTVFRSTYPLLTRFNDDTPVGKFLGRRGEGLHHVGYAVADVTAALQTLGAQGVSLIDERPRHGSLGAAIAFLHPKGLHGVLTELVQPARD